MTLAEVLEVALIRLPYEVGVTLPPLKYISSRHEVRLSNYRDNNDKQVNKIFKREFYHH